MADLSDDVADTAERLAEAPPAINATLSGGKSAGKLDGETAHYVAAAIARDVEKGHVRQTAEYIREAQSRRR